MSLNVDVGQVTAVLLADGEWHQVEDRSFYVDAYKYVRVASGMERMLAFLRKKIVPTNGATWTENGGEYIVFCPITAIQAVRCSAGEQEKTL